MATPLKMIINGELQCSKCKRWLPADCIHFNRKSDTFSGFYSQCKECRFIHGFQSQAKVVEDILSSGMKICPKCKQSLPATSKYFHKNKLNKSGLISHCKSCRSEHAIMERDNNKIRKRVWYEANRDRISFESKLKYQANKSEINKRTRAKRKTNIQFRLREGLRGRINKALNNNVKSASTIKLLGCSIPEFMKHIESQFKPGMSWENRGRNTWHTDHIKPCAAFDLSDLEQQKQCFHYTNLQPLWKHDNLSKSSNYNGIHHKFKN